MIKVCINGGHCPGIDPGALGSKTTEAEITFDLMDRVAAYLEAAGCDVLTVQDGSLKVVTKTANDWGADIFVSIHCNACKDAKGRAKGTETFAYYGSREGDALAHRIQTQIITSLATANRGVKEAGFYVLKHTAMPAALVECAFIDNLGDEQLLLDKTDEFARAIARGVTDYIVARGGK